jgi:crotonobetainyl-CoA:carnitine CoA-transferase CaiB-like acyl-CoA transferase
MPARVSAWAIYDVFETRDDPVFIGVVTDALWEKFCTVFDLKDLWEDEALRKNNDRVLARDRIMPIIRTIVAGYTRDEVIAKLEGTGLPFAPIGRPEDLFDDPHLHASGGLESVTLTNGQTAALPPVPLSMNGVRPNAASHIPKAGEDSTAILSGLGIDEKALANLIAAGVVGIPEK